VIKILKLEWKASFGRKISLILNIFERGEAFKLTYLLNIWIGFRFLVSLYSIHIETMEMVEFK